MVSWSDRYCPGMLSDVLPWLTCPHCGGALRVNGASVICSSGHTNNIARQGYVSLLGRDAGIHTADSAEMVVARDRVFDAGLFDPLIAELVRNAKRVETDAIEGPVLDLGSGPGRYLAAVLDGLPGRPGIALDNSKFAARRAAKSHGPIGAVVADIWDHLPVRDGSVALLMNLFAPRNGGEMSRVLAVGGMVIVVTPEPEHLEQLIEPFGMISVDPDKEERVDRALEELGTERESELFSWQIEADHGNVKDLVAMGPSADRISSEQVEARLAELPEPMEITGSVRIRIYRKEP